jgi:hypothetical protein
VTTSGDPNAENNAVSGDFTVVATPTAQFAFAPATLLPGQLATLAVTIGSPFPHDVTGSVTLSFVSNASIPVDDPAIQFATGGRQVTFTIPANTLQALFGAPLTAGPLGFQTGTVAGTLAFSGMLQAGIVQTTFAPSVDVESLTIPLQAPSIQAVQSNAVPVQTTAGQAANSVTVRITLTSTMREVTALSLQFDTTPAVRLDCGAVSGCAAQGATVTLDVKPLFDAWFASDRSFGSLNVLRLPLTVPQTVHGTVTVTLRNAKGLSNTMSFPLP